MSTSADDTLPGYFIAPDPIDGGLAVWREDGDRSEWVLCRDQLSGHSAVWDVLAAAIRQDTE